MLITKTNNMFHICGISKCKNIAKYVIKNPNKMLIKGTYICDDCLKDIYEYGQKIYIPKGIKNYLNK